MKKSRKIYVYLTCSILISVLFCPFSRAQNTVDSTRLYSTPSTLFQTDDLIELTLSFDMDEVLRDVGDDRIQHDASISYNDETGQQITLPVTVRTRGHFRRDPVNCNFPPLRLNFSKSETENTVFEGHGGLKLVTHCRMRSEKFEQIVLKEYLCYRIYNLFTEESFRVRLTRITYEDANGKNKPFTQFGFFIEPDKQMAARNGREIVDITTFHQERTDKEKMMMHCVFQYLIGNTDWAVPYLHNIVLVSNNPPSAPIAVPYDFDWSGLVNAPYAYPAPQLGLENVRQRLFRGFCRTEEEYQVAFDLFRGKKSGIYSLCENLPYLDEKELKGLIKYFDQFYKTIDNPKSVKSEFYLKCRTQ